MKIRLKHGLLTWLALLALSVFGQNTRLTDSLNLQFQRETSDSARSIQLILMAEEFYNANIDSAENLLTQADFFAQKSRCSNCTARVKWGQGFAKNRRFKLDEAIALYDSAAALAENCQNWYLLARVFASKGGAYNRKKDYNEALRWLRRAISVYETRQCTGDAYSIYFNEYAVLSNMGDVVNSIAPLKKAIDFAEKNKNISAQINCLISMGYTLQVSNSYEKSRVYLEKAIQLSRAIGDKYNEANALSLVGVAVNWHNQYDSAFYYLSQAKSVFGDSKDLFLKARIYSGLAISAAYSGRFEVAGEVLNEVFPMVQKSGDVMGQMTCLRAFGRMNQGLGNLQAAENYFLQAVQLMGSQPVTGNGRYLAWLALLEFYEGNAMWGKAASAEKSLYATIDSTPYETQRLLLTQLAGDLRYQKTAAEKDRQLLIAEQRRLQLEREKILANLALTQRERELLLAKNAAAQRQNQLQILEKEREIQSCDLENKDNLLRIEQAEREKSQQQTALQAARNQSLTFGIGALSLLVLLLGGAFFAIQNRQKLQAKLAQLERENERNHLREQISHDLHDEIGSTIGSIALFGKSLQKMLASTRPDAAAGLERITKNAETSLDALRDIVWTIDSRHDRAADFSARVHQFVLPAAEAAGVECSLETPMHDPNFRLSPTLKKNLWLLVKEAVANALRYSGTQKLEVKISFEPTEIQLRVRDFGIGFDPPGKLNSSSNGLKNMMLRAEQLDGKLKIESAPGRGATIFLTCPAGEK
ncbi:MAG: tetratricopeptide repeat protein [Saprospiraceae bacterium]